jgi:hypothetical protein
MKDYFYAPQHLDLEAMLRARGGSAPVSPLFLDKCYYLIDHIYLATLLHKGTLDPAAPRPYVPIHSRVLQRILTTRHAYSVKRVLIDLGIIEENQTRHGKINYCPGICSKEYRFTEQYAEAVFKRIPIITPTLIAKIEAWRAERNELAIREHGGRQLIKESIEKLKFDKEAAQKYVKQAPYENEAQRCRREITIDHFENKLFNFTTDRAGRFHHIVTLCPRDLRQFISFNEKPLYSLDVTDCQPALHATLYPPDSVERKKFIGIVSRGQFKQFINEKLPVPFNLGDTDQKKLFKQTLFREIFYGSNYGKHDSDITKVFNQEFPELADLIWHKKKYNHRDLPVEMQRLEAAVIINKIAGTFTPRQKYDKEFILVSIHDCLLTTEKYADEIRIHMLFGFYELLHFYPQIKVERILEVSKQEVGGEIILAE